jgi:hypothetical protein
MGNSVIHGPVPFRADSKGLPRTRRSGYPWGEDPAGEA